MIVGRLFAASGQSGGQRSRTTIYYPLLEDPAVLGISAASEPGESGTRTLARLEKLVADAVAPGDSAGRGAGTRQMFGFLLGTSDLPDFALARNPYGLCSHSPAASNWALIPSRSAGRSTPSRKANYVAR